MHIRMPGSIVQASQGGTSPTKENVVTTTNINNFKQLRQPTPRCLVGEEKTKGEDNIQEEGQEGQWVQGMEDKEEKEKYKGFLEYCAEKRREWRKQEEEDAARKDAAQKNKGDRKD